MPWAANEPQTIEEKVELIRGFRGLFDKDEDYVYGILPRDESEAWGGTGLHKRHGEDAFEIGYWIRESRAGQGLATEASAALTRVAFEISGVDRVEIRVDPPNERSRKVPLQARLRRGGDAAPPARAGASRRGHLLDLRRRLRGLSVRRRRARGLRRGRRTHPVIHEIPLERGNLHGHFSRELEPVLTIDPGDSVRIDVPNAGWRVVGDRPMIPNEELKGLGHALAGPIEVRGARAGQTLSIRVDEVVPGSWGVTITTPPEEHVIEWELDGTTGRAGGIEVELSPFLGVMGMPPPEPGDHPTFPPRPWGGNIDCKELVAGTTLFLPIPVDGALFSAGDGHALQADGEVCGTAIECPAAAQLTLDLRDDLELQWPAAGRRARG